MEQLEHIDDNRRPPFHHSIPPTLIAALILLVLRIPGTDESQGQGRLKFSTSRVSLRARFEGFLFSRRVRFL